MITAIAALAVVLAIALSAYSVLSRQEVADSQSFAAERSVAESSDGAAADRQGASPGVEDADAVGASDATVERGPQLSDYDAKVFNEYGDARMLTDLAAGKPFVMNFWATWCPYCVQEMADYQAIVDDYGDRVSFAFIDIADGQRETVDDASAWLYERGYTLPAYYDTTLEAMYAYGATSLPTTVVIAADGEILDISMGAINPARLRAALDSLLDA